MREDTSLPNRPTAGPPPAVDFGPRFQVEALLGTGGFGSVYAARDHVTQARVALKHLLDVDPTAILRFKKEFRALADLHHPNLVTMHELFSLGVDWYFTMELVQGVPFRTYLRGDDDDVQSASTVVVRRVPITVDGSPDEGELPVAVRPPAPVVALDEGRLRAALGQLCEGVAALHDAGMLHRDLKPSNVLVSERGRVKILDFGLITHLRPGHQEGEGSVAGTPLYMAPEQALGAALTPAADWYAVGVMLYEVLRGRTPFSGHLNEIFRQRLAGPPVDPRATATGLPDDLCELAMDLLRTDPADRPSGEAILARLGARNRASSATRITLDGFVEPSNFVGRRAELELLRGALTQSRTRATVAEVRGPSGMGKSALVRRFLDEAARLGAVVLEGRCYERESVPYKACDGLIDSLTHHLERLPADQAARLCPRHAPALARVFPVLGRLPFIAEAAQAQAQAAPDRHELRRRAFAALRELLTRLSQRQPLVLFIDDLQWGDIDSASLLAELLAAPEPPRVLLVIAKRPIGGDGHDSPILEAIRRRAGAAVTMTRLEVGPLPEADALALAEQLLGGAQGAADVVRESGASPFYLHELTRELADRVTARPLSLIEVVVDRIARVPAEARQLLEIVALAGGPLDAAILGAAAGLTDAVRDEALTLLHSVRLVRSAGPTSRALVEPLHDRIRETAISGLSAETLVDRHRRLADALLARGDADPEALALHLAAAGDRGRARGYAELAADRAADALAFDRAVGLYEQALDPPPPDAHRVLLRLADALANAGRGAEAARRYLEAVPALDEDAALDARRRAAEQLLRTGHVDEGLDVIREVLPAVGMRLVERPALALASLLVHRLRLRARGLGFEEREASAVDPAALRAIDICWSVGNGLGGVDLLRGADFQARHLLRALDAGEPYRIARALAWEAILSALEGGDGLARAAELAADAEELAQRIGHPHAMGWAAGAAAVTAWCEARWRNSSQLCEYATALFRERCADIAWELGSLELWFNLPALFLRGEIEELRRRAPACEAEAAGRGDLYAETTVRSYVLPLLRLFDDAPAAALAGSRASITRFGQKGWHLQHWSDLLVTTQAHLYAGDAAAAAALWDQAWPSLERTAQVRIQNVRLQGRYWRGRAALALAEGAEGAARKRHLDDALDAARREERERNQWGDALALSLRAGHARLLGDPDAPAMLMASASAFGALEMAIFAASARVGAAELRGDRATAAAELAEIAAAGAVAPRRTAAWHAPIGLDRSGTPDDSRPSP